MKKRIFSLILALVLLFHLLPFSAFEVLASERDNPTADNAPTTEGNDDYITGKVSLACNGKTTVTLPKGEKLYAFATPDASLGDTLMYSWELLSESGKWASVSGYVSYYATISEALIFNATGKDGSAKLRCIVTSGDKKYVSDVLTIHRESPFSNETLLSTSLPSYLSAPSTEGEETGEDIETGTETDAPILGGSSSGGTLNAFNIVISYTYRHASEAEGGTGPDRPAKIDGTTAHNSFTVTLPPNSYYSGTVATPPEIGYLPYVLLADANYVTGYNADTFETITYDNKQYVLAHSIEFTEQANDIEIHVYFIPQEVTYRVNIYEQNIHDDEYILAQTLTKTGIANSAVGVGHDTPRTGFQPLYYDPKLPISEDGSYVLDIYYDRNYYLVEFDLQDDNAFNANNHYVRYKTSVLLPTPSRPAHSFINWTLQTVTIKVNETTTETVTQHNYPTNPNGGFMIPSVEHNMVYQANWKVETTSYTIIYWLENADNDGFTLDSFEVVSNVRPGDEVSASNTLKSSDASCFTFNAALSDKNVIVDEDGTTAVNAYYLRNYYTMTFKGNAACITPEHTHNAECSAYGNCNLEIHSHTEECYDRTQVPTCGKEEHTHSNERCIIPEHAHSDSCCTIQYHVHGTGASSDCTKPEHPVHHDTCYTYNALREADSLQESELVTAYNTLKSKVSGPVNGYVYRVRIRTGSWWNTTSVIYNFLYVHNHWFYLGTANTYEGVSAPDIQNPANTDGATTSARATTICGLEVHTHGDGSCTCTTPEHDHTTGCTCTTPRHVHGEGNCEYNCDVGYEHTHVAQCYPCVCGKVAHAHGGNCVRACQQVEHTHTNNCQKKQNQNFLTFKAKYNSDISQVWRTVWTLFSNGERWKADTYFSQVLVYLPFMPPANITFTSDAGTASKIYNISYYLESLGENGTEYDDRYFTLNNTVNAKYSYLTYDEDFFNIPGFTQLTSTPAFSGDQLQTNNGGAVSLYYSRNEYDLEFVSLGTTLASRTRTLKYQQPIDSSCEVFEKDIPYPSNREKGAIRFVGWYTTPNCAAGTEFVFDGNTTMPIGGLVLYAKWETCSYNVKIYSNVELETLLKQETVLFDSLVVEPHHGGSVTNPDHDYNPDGSTNPDDETGEKLIFAGWYYKVGNEEKRFDFNTMPIKGDMVIYAKWTSRVPVSYTIRYVYHNGTEYVDIAEPTTDASLAGLTKTFHAKVGTALKDGYQVNYFPDVRSHSMTMSSTEAKNVYNFVYSSPDNLAYTVNHVFTSDQLKDILGGDNNTLTLTLNYALHGENVDEQAAFVRVSFREGITQANLVAAVKAQYDKTLSPTETTSLVNTITSLSPNAYIQNLTLTTNATQNVATFAWKNYGNEAIYQIIYYKESIDGTEYIVDSTVSLQASVGSHIDLKVADLQNKIQNFVLDKTKSTLSGDVVQPTFNQSTGALNQGLVLSVYYTRASYTYTVYHKNASGSGVNLRDPETFTAKFEHTIYVKDVAKEIPGYILTNGTGTNSSIRIAANNTQTITCYYQGLEVYYQYQVIGMGATIGTPTEVVAVGSVPTPKTLTLWNDGYRLNGWTYAVEGGERQALPTGWKLSNNDTVIAPTAPTAEWAGKTVYIYAEIVPTIRRFRVEGYHSMENDPQAFVFNLKGVAGTPTAGIDLIFFIFDSGYVDISNLPYGEYTLTTLHWAWRPGHPTSVTFNGVTQAFEHEVGHVKLNLNTTGDVVITYPGTLNEKWLSDDASGIIPVTPKPQSNPDTN